MKVIIIGSGNIATVLGRLLLQSGHNIIQVYSRNPRHAETLAGQLQAVAVSDLRQLDTHADLYLLAVTDDAMAAVAAQLSLGDKSVLHTAGSVSKDILKNVSSNYGVLWPMKMIRKQMNTLVPVTIVIDGNSAAILSLAEQVGKQLSDIVTVADDQLRVKMHMLAAVTSNFTNHLYHLAAAYCQREHIDFSFFYPLIEETAQRIQTMHPESLQAGPAMRGDVYTLEKHRQLLTQYPQLEKVYTAISESIGQTFAK